MTPPKTPPVSQMICFALYSASHAMNRAYQPLLDALGLTYPQFLVLQALWTEQTQSVGQIARTLHLESNTLTPLLKRLETMGLLTRSRNPKDERQVQVTLTETGRAIETRAVDIPACILEKSGLTLPDLIALQGQIITLRDHLRATA